jgi:hypothetical protein
MLLIMVAMSSLQEPVNIITIKWGSKYGSHYVNRLFHGVRRFIKRPVRFVCFTDDAEGIEDWIDALPLPEFDCLEYRRWSNWRKMSLFRDDLPIEGQTLFLDLDLLITGSLDELFDYGDPDSIPIIHNWIESHKTWFRPRPEVGNSSVFRFKANAFGHLYEQYLGEMEWASENFRPPQTYLTHCIRPYMCYWPEEWIISFKRHLHRPFPLNWIQQPTEPSSEVKIVAFHGKPNPDQAVEGYQGRKLHHKVLPAGWIGQYWNLLDDNN